MYRLENPSGETVQEFHRLPKKLTIPGVGNVHGVSPGWTDHGGWTLVEFTPPEPPPPSLDDLKLKLKRNIDQTAEEIRLKHITPGVGMSLTYREKLEQAEEVIAQGQQAIDAMDSAQEIATYPTLAASVGIEAATLWGCAQTVIAKYQAWATLSHEIEKRRLGGKKSIADASDYASAQAAYDAVSWAGL